MLNSLLDIVPKGENYYFDNFGEALVYALIGFLVVFLGIVLIIFIIWLLGLILRKTNNLEFLSKFGGKISDFFSRIKLKLGKKQPEQAITAVQPAETEDIPEEVKVAVVAAIMAYYSEEKPECEFRVKRIKRI